MSELLIRGIKMPESCCDCLLDYDSVVCLALNKEFPNRSSDDGYCAYLSSRMPDCPLIPVLPHGRLIDADKLLERTDYIEAEFGHIHEEIRNIPTVIPADKDGGT